VPAPPEPAPAIEGVPARTTVPADALRRPLPLSYANSRATDAEVRVAATLHDQDACLGEEINVFPMSDGSLLVQGLVDREARRDDIVQALKSPRGAVTVEIYAATDLPLDASLFDSPYDRRARGPAVVVAATPAVRYTELAGRAAPMYAPLYEQFRARAGRGVGEVELRRQVHAFSNDVVRSSRAALFHAWALERLDSEFSPARTLDLSADAVRRIEQLRADHRRAEYRIAAALAAQLSGIAGVDGGENVSLPRATDDASILATAIERHRLVQQLFVSSADVETRSVHTLLARLLTMLRPAS
jgi:hypothetical protein